MSQHIYMNAFTQCCPTPQSEGQWKNPRDRSVPGFNDPDFWIDLARTAERGFFESLFFADVHGTYDIYGGNSDAGLKHGVQVPGNEPTVLFPLLARETKQLGLIATYSTTYFEPFLTAKLFSSLDHFTNGRVGWNVVTSYLSSAQRNGLGELLEHDARYEKAEEYMNVCYKLWERSWDDGAIIRDFKNDTLIDIDRVHKISHKGEHYQVEGPHMCTPTAQRTPFLVQAGGSPRGLEFGTKHAEALFTIIQNVNRAAEMTNQVRQYESIAGRDPGTVKIMTGIGVVVAETEQELKQKIDRYKDYASVEGLLALFGGWTGLDLSGFKPEDPMDAFDTEQMQYFSTFFAEMDPTRIWNFGDMCNYMKLAAISPVITGTPDQVADELERWVDEGGVSGFNLIPVDQPGSLADFVDLVVPELQRRGRMKTEYPNQQLTLREMFSYEGNTKLPSTHPAKQAER